MEQKRKRLLLLKFFAVAQCFTSVSSNSLYTTERGESGTPGIATINLFKNARTSPAQSPSIVSFQRFISNNRHWDHGCQGTVINETHVVTTALCATWITRSGYFFGEALVGAWNLSDINELGMQRRWLKDITLFPGWHGKEIFQTFPDELKNNIALVRLEIPVALNVRIQPLRLASQESDPLLKLTNCSTTVWNWKEYLPGSVGGSPLIRMDTLHKIQLRIISNEECSQRVQKYSTGISIDADSMICAMALTDKQHINSFCPFEEGAALICEGDEEGQGPYLAGVASFGNLNKCDVNAVVYTRISHYLKFIEGSD